MNVEDKRYSKEAAILKDTVYVEVEKLQFIK
jgi:hypothetical protein